MAKKAIPKNYFPTTEGGRGNKRLKKGILSKILKILSFFDQKYLKTEKLKSGVRIALALLFTEINGFY